MFKGILIENEKYYKLKSKHLLYYMLPSIAIGFLANFYQMPIWLTVIVVIFYICIMILSIKNQKAIDTIADKQIEIEKDKILIKNKLGVIIDIIQIEPNNKIQVKANYKMAQENLSDLKEEILGHVEKHFLIIEQNQKVRRLDFIIDSHYMVNQLKKVVFLWEADETTVVEYV